MPILFKIYLKEREREQDHLPSKGLPVQEQCWLGLVRLKRGKGNFIQVLHVSSRGPLLPPPAAFSSTLAGNWIGRGAAQEVVLLWDADISSSGLTCCVTAQTHMPVTLNTILFNFNQLKNILSVLFLQV